MTRIIGLTATEFAALDRGATLILGVPREGMEPIVAGQELLAVEGNWLAAVRPDARLVRLRVTGEPVFLVLFKLGRDDIGRLTGVPRRFNIDVATDDLINYVFGLNSERPRERPLTWDMRLLAIPVEVLPSSQGEVPSIYPRKRYAYRCKCGKDSMRGTIQADPKTERVVFEALDLAWVGSHNQPGCTLADKTIELSPKKGRG